MRLLTLLLFCSPLLFAESFITYFEYGQMLYQNPRGVSCASCHGEVGEGSDIAHYREYNGTMVTLYGSDIRTVTYEQMRVGIKRGKGFMPRYLLTEKEIKAIYAYLHKVNDESNHESNASKPLSPRRIVRDGNASEHNISKLYEEIGK